MVRRTLFIFAIGMLLVLAWTGISGGVSQLGTAKTAGQTIQTAFQFVYGLFALLSIATIIRGRDWNRLMLVCWTIALALAAGIASVAWGGTSFIVGLGSGAAAGLVGAGIAWLLRFGAGSWPGE